MTFNLRLSFGVVAVACALAAPPLAVHAQTPGPALAIDAAADRHPISPFIYGMAYPDAALAKEIRLPLTRWGGDGTTRYNWQIDSTNSGDDWYFTAGGKDHPTPSAGADAFVDRAKDAGGQVLMTVPIIDYINKATAWDSSFPVSIFGPQQKVNPYIHPTVDGVRTDAGNGRKPDGTPLVLTKEQMLRINTLNTPELQRGWIQHLVAKFGMASKGGVPVYELDNEPGGWNNTHRDVHPGKTGHDELVSRSIAYAAAIKSVDPTAAVLGPGDFLLHYQSDGVPGDGAKEHGGLGQGNYYLQQMAAYEKAHNKRILDYFDGHYYPLGQDGQTDATTLESTRSLWDPTYVEKDWYGKYHGAVNLIPSFHQWVNQYYPGTKIGISEYGWGDSKTLVGALAETDVLGIFGRERLDLACLFGPPKATEAGANAFRLYRNYDGQGGQYGETWIRSTSSDQVKLAIYGSVRAKDHAVTL
ncbi:MAG: glycoside hydrolase family 44 protein, partial [Armatimonadota bacterium]|nr:glycoside hydrolase family 44 protein [Armatimonadota bacterium]